MKNKRDMPYTYWRWWLSMIFMWPIILLAVFIVLLYKSLIFIGEMLIESGEWIRDFDSPVLSRLINKFSNWIFQEN